jgi:hypothetical protein
MYMDFMSKLSFKIQGERERNDLFLRAKSYFILSKGNGSRDSFRARGETFFGIHSGTASCPYHEHFAVRVAKSRASRASSAATFFSIRTHYAFCGKERFFAHAQNDPWGVGVHPANNLPAIDSEQK